MFTVAVWVLSAFQSGTPWKPGLILRGAVTRLSPAWSKEWGEGTGDVYPAACALPAGKRQWKREK